MLNAVISLMGGGFGPYTSAFRDVVISRGGNLTSSELIHLNKFELSMGLDLSEFDRLWIHGLSNNIAARTSFVNPLSTIITAVNSPTFTSNLGYTSNGSTSYLDSNYNLLSSSFKFSRNDASLGVYINTATSGTRTEIGATGGGGGFTQIFGNRYGSSTEVYANDNGASVSASIVNSKGLTVALRSSGTSQAFVKNGTFLNTASVPSSPLSNLNLYILARNANGSANLHSLNTISLSFLASSAVNQLNFYNAVQTLGTSIGWAV